MSTNQLWLRKSGLFSDNWDGTLLATITRDLLPLIDHYCVRDLPAIKSEYKFLQIIQDVGKEGRSTLQEPFDLAIEPSSGNIFVTNMPNDSIEIYLPDYTWLRSLVPLQLPSCDPYQHSLAPTTLCFDPNDDLVIYGGQEDPIQIIDPNTGEIKLRIRDQAEGSCYGMAITKTGELLVTQYDRHVCLVYNISKSPTPSGTPVGGVMTKFGSPGKKFGQFQSPAGVTVDTEGTIYVTDQHNHRINLYDSEFKPLRNYEAISSGRLAYPWGICVDRNGVVIVVEQVAARIRFLDKEGKLLMEIDPGHGPEPGQLQDPVYATLDTLGNLLISDSSNKRVCVYA